MCHTGETRCWPPGIRVCWKPRAKVRLVRTELPFHDRLSDNWKTLAAGESRSILASVASTQRALLRVPAEVESTVCGRGTLWVKRHVQAQLGRFPLIDHAIAQLAHVCLKLLNVE